MPKKLIHAAAAYDFDGTLAEGNIQENTFIPDLGISKNDFWKKVGELSKEHEMDEILSYMYLLLKEARNRDLKIDRNSFKKHGKKAVYFRGVEEYFDRINRYALSKQIKLDHYIISSGTKEMIEGTSIAKHFKTIYASSFKYDRNGVAEWPAIAINYTTKTQYLFRINKGVENAWDNSLINEYIEEYNRPIPFENMIYIGDGLTDVPAMKVVKANGGTSIGVYESKKGGRKRVEKLLNDRRVSYVAKADYSEGGELDKIIRSVLDRISAKASVEKYSLKKFRKDSEKNHSSI